MSKLPKIEVLHEDNHLIVINKKSGDIVQGDKTGDKPLNEIVKEYIKIKYKICIIKATSTQPSAL